MTKKELDFIINILQIAMVQTFPTDYKQRNIINNIIVKVRSMEAIDSN